MDVAVSKHLMVGLPATGKTTFLAALWHVVESGDVQRSLKLERLQGDRDYLNWIRERWLCCEPIERTVQAAEKLVSMRLLWPESGMVTEVYFPDMSGESFNLHWTERKWSKEYDDLVSEASGVLLFIHPEQVFDPIRIGTADTLVAELGGDEEDSSSEDEEFTLWDPNSAATQVKLVELLQFFVLKRDFLPIFKVSVIISAWDLVLAEGKSPEEWLQSRLPLLDQYLKANSELFPFRAFGVSAQGGRLDLDAQRLRKGIRASERIIVVGPECEKNDLTAPVKWHMS